MKRWKFLINASKTLLALANPALAVNQVSNDPSSDSNLVTVFMCGDVMTGRGIDQVLPHPSNPRIYELYMQSVRGYVELAAWANRPTRSVPGPTFRCNALAER
jgi:poly-gamma-glutamate synthesis protein (capsule biosynthesis protein)